MLTRFALLTVAAVVADERGCNPNRPRTAVVSILTTLPYIPSMRQKDAHPHVREALLAIGENTRSNYVRQVVVIIDKFRGLEGRRYFYVSNGNATLELRKNVRSEQLAQLDKLDFQAHPKTDLTKIQAYVYGRQPTYAELFRFAGSALPRQIVALINADVVLRNLDLLDGDAFVPSPVQPPLAFVLAVRSPTGNFARACAGTGRTILDKCDLKSWSYAGFSWDAYIFWSPLTNTARYDLLEDLDPGPVYMNSNGAENRAGHFLAMSGYDLVNPCHNNLTEHWHCTGHTHYFRGGFTAPPDLSITPAGRLRGAPGGFVKTSIDTFGLRCPINIAADDDAQNIIFDA